MYDGKHEELTRHSAHNGQRYNDSLKPTSLWWQLRPSHARFETMVEVKFKPWRAWIQTGKQDLCGTLIRLIRKPLLSTSDIQILMLGKIAQYFLLWNS